jgi:hypothetical protein
MRLLPILAALVTAATSALTPALAQLNDRATLLLEDKPHNSSAVGREAEPQDFLHGPATWTVSPDGARAAAQFEIPGHLKGAFEFTADKTLASPDRAMVVRLDLQDPANDPIADVLFFAVDALEYPTGPRVKGVISRRDDKTFDLRLDDAKANVDAIGVGRSLDVEFRLQSGRIGRISIERDEVGAAALAHLFPSVRATDREAQSYRLDLLHAQSEAEAARILFGGASSGTLCFARVYDADHLRAHPFQRVTSLALILRMAPWSSAPEAEDDGDPHTTQAFWGFTANATLRDGAAVGEIRMKLREMQRIMSGDDLRDHLVFDARNGAVEDSPDRIEMTDDGRHLVFHPYDEMGFGLTWPDKKDPAYLRKAAKIKEDFSNLDEVFKTDDESFRLDRADPSVCAQITLRARGGTRVKTRG